MKSLMGSFKLIQCVYVHLIKYYGIKFKMLSMPFEAALTKQYLNQEHSNSVSFYTLFYVIQDENIGWKVVLVAVCKEQIMQVSS